jgi:hypothetical protein
MEETLLFIFILFIIFWALGPKIIVSLSKDRNKKNKSAK